MAAAAEPPRLDADDIGAIARQVAELLAHCGAVPKYLDTTAVARMLGCSEDWVRDHASELGAARIGDGPKGALRFEVRRVEEALERRRVAGAKPARRRARPGPARRPAAVELIPLPSFPEPPR
jgi:hypothetical protein